MIKDIFINYKIKYLKYIILIKSGNFYLALSNDAKIINNIFDFKIKDFSNTIKVGFPLISLNKVIDKLELLKINYIVVEKDIRTKRKFNVNNYDKYLKRKSNGKRINDINRKLLSLENTNIDVLLNNIEDLI